MKRSGGLFRSMMCAIGLIIIVAVVSFDFALAIGAWNDERSQNLRDAEKLSDKVQNAVKNYIEQMDATISSLYYDLYSDPQGDVYKLLSRAAFASAAERIAVNRYLNTFFSKLYLMQPDLISIYLYVNEGKSFYYSAWGRAIRGYSPLGSQWYRDTLARGGRTYMRLNYLPEGATYKKPVVGFSRKLVNVTDEQINEGAVLLLEFSTSMIEDIVSGYTINEESQVLFLDDAGSTVYKLGNPDAPNQFPLDEIDLTLRQSGVARIDETSYILSTTGQKAGNWYIVVLSDYQKLLETFGNYLAFSAILVLVMIALAMIPAYAYVRRLYAQINMLERGMASMCEGNFSIRLNTTWKNEVGSLVQSFNTMAEKTQELIRRQYQQELEKREAQYKYLQAQIDPHFIFNSLQVIGSMALVRKAPEIEKVSSALARLLSYSLSADNKEITIREELKNVDRYMIIQQTRFKDRLSYHAEVEEALLEVGIIKMALQPIVENAISHGFNQHAGQGLICIRGYRRGNLGCIEVRDNGSGMTRTQLQLLARYVGGDDDTGIQPRGHGVGLRNINNRLKLYYGDTYGLKIESEPEIGTTVSVFFDASGRKEHDKNDDRR